MVPNKKFFIRLLIAVIILSAVTFLFLNENGVLKFIKLKGEINRLDDEIKKAEMKLQSLQEEIDSLNTKKEKIEKVARERYNMMFPEENVLGVEEK
jgi:cell division protein FtsL